MENNLNKKNLKKISNIDSPKNIQILTMVINNNIYNLNDFNLNNILLPFLIHNNKKNYYNPQKNAFIFPEAIDIDSLQLFCNFLLTPEKINMTKYSHIKKILNVCIFFNSIDIINKISDKYILSKLNKDNCLDIIIYFQDFLYIENEIIKDIFVKIIQKSILLISQNLIFFIKNKQTELYSINSDILEQIIELYLKEIDNEKILNEDIKNILELLIYSRGISNDIFLLLENERKKAIKNFESLFYKNKDKLEPTFIWKIAYDDIKINNYQEKTIYFDNLNILLISYYDYVNDSFQLAIQILDFKNNNNNNNNYKTEKNDNNNNDNDNGNDNDNDNLLNTSTAKKIKNNKQILLSEDIKKDKENTLINILLLCEISEINYKSHINFNGIYTKNNSRFLVCKIDNFIKKIKNQKNGFEFSLKIYFSRNYIFPKIIEHICQDFDKYYNLPSINKLPRSAMNILFKNDNISNDPNKENYKLYAIENWIKYKNGNISKKYIDIFKNIDWKNIDNNKLIDFFMENAKLISKEESLKNDIFFEIQRRFQEEYASYYLNNKTFLNNSKSFSISNFEDIQEKNNYLSFTFDFLTKILSKLISNNNNEEYSMNGDNSKDITYVFPNKEEKQINFPITQRNNIIPKNKISTNIILNKSPLSNDCNESHLKYKTELINTNNNIINNIKINKKKNNNNIPSNRHEKKSSNNSLSSYQINNMSGLSGMDYLNSGSGNVSIYNNKKTDINQHIDKNEINSLVSKGIKSFTPNNSKGRFIIKNKENININKYNRTIGSKPSRIQYKKNHSKSADKFILMSEDKNNQKDLNLKKHGLFPNYIRNIQNENVNMNDDMQIYNNINQVKKKLPKDNNISAKIPIQYNNHNKKISISFRNNGYSSNKNNNNSKSQKYK